MSLIRVDFYLVGEGSTEDMWTIGCRLLEKAYQRDHRVFVWCETHDDAITLDDRLWTYKAESFVPHALQWENITPTPPIQIGCDISVKDDAELLLNLTPSIPVFYTGLRRIMEIVPAGESAKVISRDHYRAYRAQGCELHTHAL